MITPAQTFLKEHAIPYHAYEYECTVDRGFGAFAARALGVPEERVFKTIILRSGKTYVSAVVPVSGLISLRNAARLLHLKSLELAAPADARRVTGYVIGGISPFGQKKSALFLVCASALRFEEILVSGGRRGFSIGVSPRDLIAALKAVTGDFLEAVRAGGQAPVPV